MANFVKFNEFVTYNIKQCIVNFIKTRLFS